MMWKFWVLVWLIIINWFSRCRKLKWDLYEIQTTHTRTPKSTNILIEISHINEFYANYPINVINLLKTSRKVNTQGIYRMIEFTVLNWVNSNNITKDRTHFITILLIWFLFSSGRIFFSSLQFTTVAVSRPCDGF